MFKLDIKKGKVFVFHFPLFIAVMVSVLFKGPGSNLKQNLA